MLYTVYGVLGKSGHNVKRETHKSLRKACQALTELNELTFPLFIILKHERVCSTPISCYSGKTVERKVNRVKSFLTGENPTREKDGPAYWKGR